MVVYENGLYLRLTVVVDLVGVWNQPAVIWPRRQNVRDPIVVVVVVTLVTQPVLVGVQLGAVDHEWAIILGILVTVAIAAGEVTGSHDVNKSCSTGSSGKKHFGYLQEHSIETVMMLLPVLVCVTGVSNQVIVNIRLKQEQKVQCSSTSKSPAFKTQLHKSR